jgi:lipoprotein-releasing system ATP-binding protein
MVLELQDIGMKFKSGENYIEVLKNVNFSIKKGESVALVAPSGTGKTTLLQISALLEKPTTGKIFINGRLTRSLNDNEETKLRRENIGFVYQFHNLLPEFSALENVMIPLIVKNVSKKDARKRAEKLLADVEMSHRLDHSPKKLSGGEQQRVAIARAFANDPDIIIADEPTGNLDPINAETVFNLFINLVENKKKSLFVATHNIDLAKKLNRVVKISSGTIVSF